MHTHIYIYTYIYPPTPSGVERVRTATITNYESPMTIAKSLTFINQTTNQRNNQPFHQSSCRPTNKLSNHHPTSNHQSPNSINTRETQTSHHPTNNPTHQTVILPTEHPTNCSTDHAAGSLPASVDTTAQPIQPHQPTAKCSNFGAACHLSFPAKHLPMDPLTPSGQLRLAG